MGMHATTSTKEQINIHLLQGNKVYQMEVGRRLGGGIDGTKLKPKILFRDSINLIPGFLASMVDTFELDIPDKPFFPHLANHPDNYGRRIYPTKDDYLADGMMPAKRKQFDAWYEQNKGKPFVLEEELAAYCCNDTDILMHALVRFQHEFREVSKRPVQEDGRVDRQAFQTPHDGIDVLRQCMTIAKASMTHFRTNHLKPNHLAICPEKGYDSADTQR